MNDTQPKTESVRIESSVLNQVREHVKDTRQTVGGFISHEIEKVMARIAKRKSAKK
jgi:hypothetical protein